MLVLFNEERYQIQNFELHLDFGMPTVTTFDGTNVSSSNKLISLKLSLSAQFHTELKNKTAVDDPHSIISQS